METLSTVTQDLLKLFQKSYWKKVFSKYFSIVKIQQLLRHIWKNIWIQLPAS